MAKGVSAEAREDILVQAFLTCPNISEISKKTKIPRPTIYTVIHSDSFQRKYSEARNEAVTGAIVCSIYNEPVHRMVVPVCP